MRAISITPLPPAWCIVIVVILDLTSVKTRLDKQKMLLVHDVIFVIVLIESKFVWSLIDSDSLAREWDTSHLQIIEPI